MNGKKKSVAEASTFVVNNMLGKIIIYSILCAGVVIVFAPLFIVINVSLKSNSEYMMKGVYSLPENIFNIQNYVRAFIEGKFLTGFLNTGILVLVSVPLAILLGTMVAYTLSRFDFKLKRIILLAFLIPTFIPGMTVTIATFQIIKALGVYNSIMAGVILYIGTDIMQIYIFLQFINQIPMALDESARIDGASRLCTYFRIILPQLKPAIATAVILKILGIYNDFFTPYMYMPKIKTAATGLYSFSGDKLAEWPLMSAAIILVAVPTIIIYVFLQKYIISGVTDGAVK